MLSTTFTVLAAAAFVSAKTPAGFEPAATTDLIVDFKNVAAMNGAVVAKEATQTAPTVATTQKLSGTSYAILMIDLDIPTDSPPETSTLLHWMQTGLVPATTATVLNTTMGQMQAFVLQNAQNITAAAEYFGPSPPARVPLSHRYTQILVDTSEASTTAMNALTTAAQNRRGFEAMNVLMTAGLMDSVVAGNSFNVTNPGPAASTNGTGGTFANSTGGGSAQGTSSGPTPTATFANSASVLAGPTSGAAVFLLSFAALFLAI